MSAEAAQAEPTCPGLLLKRARLLRSVRELGMELLIVTLGVFAALWAQQWAEGRSWREKTQAATDAIRVEVADQYESVVEWRTVEPCVLAQIDRLQQRVVASGVRLIPAPVFADPSGYFVLRLPDRSYEDAAWQRAAADGVASRLDRTARRRLDQVYPSMRLLNDLTAQNRSDVQRLLSLSRPLPLDAGVRIALVQDLDDLSGRVAFMDLIMGQSLRSWRAVGMLPSVASGREVVAASGSATFCRAHGLPLRSLAEAVRPAA